MTSVSVAMPCPSWVILLLSFALYALMLLLPLVPAMLTYRASPNKRIFAEGKLAWLTVRAGGAFAAYLITLVLSWSLGTEILGLLKAEHAAQLSSTTMLYIDVRLLDAKGNPIDESLANVHPIVRLNPDIYEYGQHSIAVRVPGKPEDYGYSVEVPNFGTGYRAKHEVKCDRNNLRNFRLLEPIDVRKTSR